MSKQEIPLFKVFMSPEVLGPLSQVVMSGYIGQGPKVDEFERMLAGYFGNPYVNTLNCATSGIHLALRMLKDDHPEADEVLTVPLTCTATNFPILANGLKLKWVDIDPKTGNIDLDDLARKLSAKTLAVIVVHWGGYPVDLYRLQEIINQASILYDRPIHVIQDAAHALGATYDNKPIGFNMRHFVVFSFQAIKHVTTGDGGVLVCPTDEYHRRAKLLRWYGLDRTSSADFRCEQNIAEWGYKFHMNDIAATIGLANLPHLDEIVGKHRQNAFFLENRLRLIKGVTMMENKPDRQSAYWVFTIRVERRNQFMKAMKKHGIATSMVHNRNDQHDCLREFRALLPGTDQICADMACIPCGWWLTQDDLEYIVDCMKKGW